jgi:hypothetical protein
VPINATLRVAGDEKRSNLLVFNAAKAKAAEVSVMNRRRWILFFIKQKLNAVILKDSKNEDDGDLPVLP